MKLDTVVFFLFAAVAIISSIMMLTSRRTIHAALFLVLNFATVAVLYLLLSAPFIAMVQITVYTGAIMVLFLFVIMLLGVDDVEATPSLPMQAPIAIVLAVVLALLLGYAIVSSYQASAAQAGLVPPAFGGPVSIGTVLFSRYLVPFEVTSIVLLVAMVGAIVLARSGYKQKDQS